MANDSCGRLTPEELSAFAAVCRRRTAQRSIGSPSNLEVRCFESGEVIMQEGMPATEFVVCWRVKFHFRRPSDPYSPVFVRIAGQATGVLAVFPDKNFCGRGYGGREERDLRSCPRRSCANWFIALLIWRKSSFGNDRPYPGIRAKRRADRARCWLWENFPPDSLTN